MITFLASMKRWCFFIVLFICKEGFALSASDSLLNTLRQEIANRERYINLKSQRIEDINRSLRALRNPSVNDRFAIYNRLYHEYKVFIYDSAFKYAQRLSLASYQSGEQSKIGYARLKTAFILVSSGMFKETFDSLQESTLHI